MNRKDISVASIPDDRVPDVLSGSIVLVVVPRAETDDIDDAVKSR